MVIIDIAQKAEIGLDTSRLRTVTELRLRTAGLEVVPVDPSAILRVPVLGVNVTAIATSQYNGRALGYAYSTNVKLSGAGRLMADSAVLGELVLWQAGRINSTPTDLAGDVEKTVDDLLDRFLNDWLAANPKR